MDFATGFAATTTVVYALVTLAVGFWVFWGDTLLLGVVVLTAAVLAPVLFSVSKDAMRAQLGEPN